MKTAVVVCALGLGSARLSAADVRIEKVTCLELPNCYRLSNGAAEVVVTTDVGPRIAAYRLAGGENVFRERAGTGPKTEWRSYGGHRLWAAPEARPRTYAPDNDPVEYQADASRGAITLTAPVEPLARIQKTIRVVLDAAGPGVTVEHTITNKSAWPIELAPWAVTVMKGGGTAIVPQEPPPPPDTEMLLPVRSMALWAYTNMSDARFTFGRRYVRLRSDEAAATPLKIGFGNKAGWAAYHRDGTLFVKRFAYENDARYADFGSNNELYTNGAMLEVETMGRLQTIAPGASATHVERWGLFKDVAIGTTDDDLDGSVLPLTLSGGEGSARR
jgi:hypothetical protein